MQVRNCMYVRIMLCVLLGFLSVDFLVAHVIMYAHFGK